MNLAIQLHGLDQLIDAWGRAPEIVVDELAKFAEGASHFMQGEIQERTPTAEGKLKASFIAQDPVRLSDGVIGAVGSASIYAVPVELGTKPHFPPIAPLMDWVKVKFGAVGPAGERIAYAIARKIAKRGTKGHHMVQQAFDAGRPEVERQFALAIARVQQRLAQV